MSGEQPRTHALLEVADASGIDLALAELRELTAELQASRTRIVEAGDEARRRLERDLHDGAQQRFVTASLLLGSIIRAVERGEVDELAGELSRVRDELDRGLAELR